jgi:hypothetical protein
MLTVAIMLWNPSSVRADFRTQLDSNGLASVGPFDLFHVARQDSIPPVNLAAANQLPSLVVSSSASAIAGLGPLQVGVEADAANLLATGIGGPLVRVSAEAQYSDDFSAFFRGSSGSHGTLVFTLALHGRLLAGGVDFADNNSLATVRADFGVANQVPLFGFGSSASMPEFNQRIDAPDLGVLVTSPFTVSVGVLLGADNAISISGDLFVSGVAISPGSGASGFATSDFTNTFSITSLQLFNDQGQFVENVTLTDALGNKLQVGAPAAAAPEPASIVLLILGSLGLAGYAIPSRRQPAAAA